MDKDWPSVYILSNNVDLSDCSDCSPHISINNDTFHDDAMVIDRLQEFLKDRQDQRMKTVNQEKIEKLNTEIYTLLYVIDILDKNYNERNVGNAR